MTYTPSKYQQDFYNWIQDGTGNALVAATAGSGKTTSMITAANMIPSVQRCLFLAFNASIAKELKERVPKHCEASTLNSVGHRAWAKHVGRVEVDAFKMRSILGEIMGEEDFKYLSTYCCRMLSLAKAAGCVPEGIPNVQIITKDTDQFWTDMVDFYSIEIPFFFTDKGGLSERGELIIYYCREALKKSITMQNKIDFDDQLYMTSIHQIPLGTFDFVFCDEGQDTNKIQQEMLKLAMTMNTRLVVVGDSRQSIYSFRSALSDSLDRIKETFKCKVLPLSICYRCPTSHLDIAREIVPEIENGPNAITGEVQYFGEKWDSSIFLKNDLIICRYNAPLVKTAYKLLSAKLPVKILGRDIGQGIINLIKKMKAKSQNDLTEKIERWKLKETEKMLKKDPKANTDSIDDKYETVLAFQEMFSTKSVEGMISGIEQIYSDGNDSVITLASVHRSKGLESERVFVINYEDMPSKRARKDWQIQEELNIKYIAVTRAKKYLGFITVARKKRD